MWKFLVHVPLKPSLKIFELYLANVWNENNCAVVWAFFGIVFLWDWNDNWPFPVLWPLLSFPNLLAYWVQHLNSIIFFRIRNSSAGIPSPPQFLFIVMLPKAHLTSHSRMSGSRSVTTPLWLSGSLRAFLYSSFVYSCHLLFFFFFCFIFKNLFIYFNWRLITLQYCSGFAIHWHGYVMGVQVYLIVNHCSSPSPSHPSGSSQCTSPEHPVSCIEPGLAIYFTYGNIHVSVLFSQIIPPSPSPTESKSLFFIYVSLLLSCIQGHCYHLYKFHIYVLVCCNVFIFLAYFTLYNGLQFHPSH